jgi:predicted dinucleotide-binding enzyme
MATKIGIIGAGNMGIAMGTLWARAGHEVRVAFGRDATKVQQAAASIRGGAIAAEPADVARFADVIVLAVPWPAAADAVKALGNVKGKVVWTIINPFKPDFSGLEFGTTTCAGEEIAKLAEGAKVVEGLPLFAEVLSSPERRFDGMSASVFYCGDDADAKVRVAELLGDLDVDAVDAGPLSSGRFIEPAMMLLMRIQYAPGAAGQYGFKLLRRQPLFASRS